MATPVFNSLSTKLSLALRDSASTDFSQTVRDSFLNRANLFIQQTLWGQFLTMYGDSMYSRDAIRRVLQSQAKESGALTLTATGVSVPTDFTSIAIAFVKTSSTNPYFYRANKQELDSNANMDLKYAYTIQGRLLYAYENGVVVSTSTGKLTYIASDQVTRDGATDILLGIEFHDALIDIAAWYALLETPKADVAPAQVFHERAMSFLGRFR